jgi:hypothetical protein
MASNDVPTAETRIRALIHDLRLDATDPDVAQAIELLRDAAGEGESEGGDDAVAKALCGIRESLAKGDGLPGPTVERLRKAEHALEAEYLAKHSRYRPGSPTTRSAARTPASCTPSARPPVYVKEMMGHSSAHLALEVYAREMNRRDGEQDKLRILVEGTNIAPQAHDKATKLPNQPPSPTRTTTAAPAETP